MHGVETLGVVYVVERRGIVVVPVLVMVREQCGEPRAQRSLVRVWRDVPNHNDAAGAVSVIVTRRKRRLSRMPSYCSAAVRMAWVGSLKPWRGD
jgi:hypothetical protein